MDFIDQIKGLIASGKIQETSTNMLEDVINAVLGDPVSIGKIIIALAKSSFLLREQIFWTKMEAFLNGTYLHEDDCAKLCAKLTENGENRDNSLRLVESIDRAETQQKIQYLINATRCLLSDFIDRPTFFRICHIVTHTLEEDLVFLSKHIKEADILYNATVQGLLTSGLMYQSVIDSKGEQKYSFTPLAEIVDRFAISYNDLERYPNPRGPFQIFSSPQPKLPDIPEWKILTDDDFNEMWGNR